MPEGEARRRIEELARRQLGRITTRESPSSGEEIATPQPPPAMNVPRSVEELEKLILSKYITVVSEEPAAGGEEETSLLSLLPSASTGAAGRETERQEATPPEAVEEEEEESLMEYIVPGEAPRPTGVTPKASRAETPAASSEAEPQKKAEKEEAPGARSKKNEEEEGRRREEHRGPETEQKQQEREERRGRGKESGEAEEDEWYRRVKQLLDMFEKLPREKVEREAGPLGVLAQQMLRENPELKQEILEELRKNPPPEQPRAITLQEAMEQMSRTGQVKPAAKEQAPVTAGKKEATAAGEQKPEKAEEPASTTASGSASGAKKRRSSRRGRGARRARKSGTGGKQPTATPVEASKVPIQPPAPAAQPSQQEERRGRQLTLEEILRKHLSKPGARSKTQEEAKVVPPMPPRVETPSRAGMVKLYAVFVKMPSRSMFQRVEFTEEGVEKRVPLSKTAEKAIQVVESRRTSIYQPAYKLGMISLGSKLWVHVEPEMAEMFAKEVAERIESVFRNKDVVKALEEKYGVGMTPSLLRQIVQTYMPRISVIEMPAEIALELAKAYLSEKLDTLQRLRKEAAAAREEKKRRAKEQRIRQLERQIEQLRKTIAKLEKLAGFVPESTRQPTPVPA